MRPLRSILHFWSLCIRLIWLKIFPITSQAILRCRNKTCLTVSGSKINLMSFRFMNQGIHLKLMWHLLFSLNKFPKNQLYSLALSTPPFLPATANLKLPVIYKPLQSNEFFPLQEFLEFILSPHLTRSLWILTNSLLQILQSFPLIFVPTLKVLFKLSNQYSNNCCFLTLGSSKIVA